VRKEKSKKALKDQGIFRVLREIGGYPLLIFSLFANIAEGIGNAFAIASGGKMLDAFLSSDKPLAIQQILYVLFFALLLTAGILVKDTLLGYYQENGMVRLRKKTISVLSGAKMDWLDTHHSGELSSRTTSDLNALGNSLRPVLIMGLSSIIAHLIPVLYMFYVNWLLTLIVLAIVPLITFLQWLASYPIKKYQAANRSAAAEISSVVADTSGGYETVKALQLEEEMQRRFLFMSQKQYTADCKTNWVTAFLAPLSSLGTYLPQLILLLIGGLFVIDERLSIGQLIIFVGLSRPALRVMDSIFSLFSSLRKLSVNAQRIADIWDSPSEFIGKNTTPSEESECITFENVSFSYQENQKAPTLSDITFSGKKGEFIALVGESGCGKSTIFKLLSALYTPTGGKIYVLGHDFSAWNPASLRERIAYVTQDVWLFQGSLLENIACGEAIPTPETYQISGLSEFIQNHPQKEQVPVGERGVLLSGGQRQRISIARALCKNAEILLLDEATSALDSTMEKEIIESILSMKQRPTILMITHRLSGITKADQILVIKDGHICQKGTHQELAGTGGVYDTLLARQREEVSF